MASCSVRLAVLLRSFGLSAADFAGKESKTVVAVLRTEYFRLAKENHPDRVPTLQQAEAAVVFAKLQNEFHEAVKLLEQGVHLHASAIDLDSAGYSAAHQSSGAARPVWPHTDASWKDFENGQDPAAWSTRAKQQENPDAVFDFRTKVKFHLLFWSGLFVFGSMMREFLVSCAGCSWSWQPPVDWNPLVIRRFQADWHAHASELTQKQSRGHGQEAQQSPKPVEPDTKVREVSTFYQKRVKRMYDRPGNL